MFTDPSSNYFFFHSVSGIDFQGRPTTTFHSGYLMKDYLSTTSNLVTSSNCIGSLSPTTSTTITTYSATLVYVYNSWASFTVPAAVTLQVDSVPQVSAQMQDLPSY